MESLLQPLFEYANGLLQPVRDGLEQLRFYVALILNAVAALCFAQTLDERATFVSRCVYLLVLWFLLPTTLSLVDSFYSLLWFSSREQLAAWLWLVKPCVFLLLAGLYIGAIVRMGWKKTYYAIVCVLGILAMLHRLFQHFAA